MKRRIKVRWKRLLSVIMMPFLIAAMIPTYGFPVLAAEGDVAINATNFPDANFREYVKKFDKNGDNVFSRDELSVVWSIDCTNMQLTSLNGIEFFYNLNGLYARDNSIHNIDLSQNDELRVIYVDENPLEKLILGKNVTSLYACNCQLESLNLQDLSNLSLLYCWGNHLSSLDISHNKKLQYLGVESNYLDEINLSNNTELQDVWISSNHISSLDLSNNTKIKSLRIGNTFISNVSDIICNLTELEYLECGGLEISELDVSTNKKLRFLDCAYTNISSIDLSNNIKLDNLKCNGTNLTQIDITNNPELINVWESYPGVEYFPYNSPVALVKMEGYTADHMVYDTGISGMVVDKDLQVKGSHTAGEPVKENVISAGCETAGSYDEVTYCSGCGEELKRVHKTISPTGHRWGEWVVTKEPTEDYKGTKTRTCSECHKEESEDIPAVDHVHNNPTLIPQKDATCTEDGLLAHYQCRCGDLFEDEACTKPFDVSAAIIPAGHDWDEGVISKPATCTEKGTKTYTCKKDPSHIRTEEIDALGHIAGSAVKENVVDAGCEEEGSYEEVVYCTVCKEELSRVSKTIPAGNHEWNDGEVITQPSCTTEGTKLYTCLKDSTHTKIENIPALGHDVSSWTVVKEATVEEEGERHGVCSRCGEEFTEVIPKINPAQPANDDWLEPLRIALACAAEAGTEQSVDYTGDFSLPYEIMKYLKDHPQVTLNYHYVNGSDECTVSIPGSKAIANPEISWYGPMWLVAYYGGGLNTVPGNGKYIIQKGDTLYALAIRFGTTIQALVDKNGIKNPNLIFAGQQLVY